MTRWCVWLRLFDVRCPLIDGQGNFGSMDGDSAAALRLRNLRLDKVAVIHVPAIWTRNRQFHPTLRWKKNAKDY